MVSETQQLVVDLLGPPEVTIDGAPIVVDTRKAVALLAYLVVEHSATRDTLSGLFWAEATQERARATLRRTLSALRAATGGDFVRADRTIVTLTGPISSDYQQFLSELEATSGHDHDLHDVCERCIPHLRRAMDLYRGGFMEGFSVRASPQFDDWVRTVGESARIRAGEAHHRLATAMAAGGDYQAAIAAVTRWIALDDLHEPAHRLLMLLNAWAGDRPGAIEAYRGCVDVFDRELGVAPLEETTELYEAILDEDLPPAPGSRRPVKAEATPARVERTEMIDRESELAGLLAALDDVAGGRGRVVAVLGAPWMGKTRLVEELSAVATSRDWHVLFGRAFRMESALPYGVVTQLLRNAMPHFEQPRPQIPDWALTEIGRLVPEASPAPSPELPDRFGELRLFEAIRAALEALCLSQPLLIVLDDLQWMDHASAAALSYVARRAPALRALIVATVRSGEMPAGSHAELLRAADRTIEVAPLHADQLVQSTGGDAGKADELVQRTGGIPLLIAEALTTGGDGMEATPGMTRFIEARLREIGDLGRQILTTAAVLRGTCDAALLRETSGRSDDEVVEAVEELVAAGLLQEAIESDGLSFTLDALEEITYESTSLVRRRLLHRRAARALADRSRLGTDPQLAASVAAQFHAAGDPEAAGWYRIAGDLARAVYANDSAHQFYEAALASGEPDVAGVRLALGELALVAGDYNQARQELTVAVSHAGPGVTGQIEHRMGDVERLVGRFDLAAEHYGRSLTDHPAPTSVLADWALLAQRTGDNRAAAELADRAKTAAEASGDPASLSRARNIQAVVEPDPALALAYIEQAIRLAADDEVLLMAALNNNALLLADNGEVDPAIELIHQAISLAERTGHRHREAALWNHLADLHHQAGRQEEAREAVTRSVELFADVDAGSLQPELWLLSRW